MFGFFFRTRVRTKKIRRNATSRKSYLAHREAARALVHDRLEHFNASYRFLYKKVFIKDTRTKWGSCSTLKNLNFNYRIVFLEPELQDYLIVHELCHLQEMNHGEGFWNLVEETIPDYRERARKLRKVRMV